MKRVYPVADQAAACLKRINFEHPAFKNCDTSSLETVAARVRESIKAIDLPDGDGMNLRTARDGETPEQLIARCLGNTWRVVGHEYRLDDLDYNSSPDPAENNRYRAFGEWTWQLNRHQEWLIAALDYHRTGNPFAMKALRTWIQKWVETCPRPTREFDTELSSWRTIEIGSRLGRVWPYVFHVVKNNDAIDDELLLAWLNSVAEQCDFVWSNRKKKNWLMIEMNGLLTAGLMFPFFTDAATWEANALRVHMEEIDNQFHPDGMQIELSASYHGVSFVQYLRAYTLLKNFGRPVPPGIITGMRKMLKPWRAMARPNGRVFDFQDSCVVDYAEWLRRLPSKIHAPEDMFFLSGGPAPDHLNDLLPNAGQAVLRSGWTMDDTAVAIDAGPYGEGHQHEDKLSIQIWSRGQDLLGEAGIVDYADSPQRRYSFDTLAHSTAIIDGRQQNSKRLFEKGARPLDATAHLTCDMESTTPWIKAAYTEGYGPEGEIAVRHDRTVKLTSRDLITITDQFHAADTAPHTIEILFHLLKEGYEIRKDGARSLGEGPNIDLATRCRDGDTPLKVSGVCGGSEPDLRGWASMDPAEFKGTFELVPRPCITITATMSRSIEIVTEISILD